jgi:hypothetical protein
MSKKSKSTFKPIPPRIRDRSDHLDVDKEVEFNSFDYNQIALFNLMSARSEYRSEVQKQFSIALDEVMNKNPLDSKNDLYSYHAFTEYLKSHPEFLTELMKRACYVGGLEHLLDRLPNKPLDQKQQEQKTKPDYHHKGPRYIDTKSSLDLLYKMMDQRNKKRFSRHSMYQRLIYYANSTQDQGELRVMPKDSKPYYNVSDLKRLAPYITRITRPKPIKGGLRA